MKKWFRTCTIAVIIYVICETFPMSVSEVQASNINYTISYSTQVIGTAQIKCEGDMNPIYLERYQKQFNVDITDSSITSAIENYKREALTQINQTTPNTIVSDRSFRDGYVYPIPPENVKHFFRFFELPTNFNGTKIIKKDGIPFTVTGDGKGNLSMTIVSDLIGTEMKTFVIPEEKTHTIKEEMVSQNYNVFYHVPNSATEFMPGGSSASYNAKTLEEALEYCAQNADLDKAIRIFVTQTYRVDIAATSSYKVNLNVTYGNVSSNTTKNPSITQDTSSANKNSSSETTVVVPQNNEQTSAGVLVENEFQTQTDEIITESENVQKTNDTTVVDTPTKKTEKKELNLNKKTSLKSIITFCIVAIFVFGLLSILLVSKIIKKKRE